LLRFRTVHKRYCEFMVFELRTILKVHYKFRKLLGIVITTTVAECLLSVIIYLLNTDGVIIIF